MFRLRREPRAGRTGILQAFGVSHYRRFYLPFWLWCLGLFASYLTVAGAFFWVDVFAVEGVAV